jgi:hypothetical protein
MHDRIPVILCIDVEPDPLVPAPVEDPWLGYRKVLDLVREIRPRLAAATGVPARLAWFFRMDPEIEEAWGAADAAVAARADAPEWMDAQGDEIGLHVHVGRWSAKRRAWLLDYDDRAGLDHCVRFGLDTFARTLGRPARCFRGGWWLDASSVRLLAAHGVRVDLTIQPGHDGTPPHRAGQIVVGRCTGFRGCPRAPYRPSPDDLLLPDPVRRDGPWLVPVTAACWDGPRAWARRLWRKGMLLPRPTCYTADLYLEPRAFARIVEWWLRNAPESYLALVVRTSVGRDPAQIRHLLANLARLLRHPLAERFVFATPEAALALLGRASTSG